MMRPMVILCMGGLIMGIINPFFRSFGGHDHIFSDMNIVDLLTAVWTIAMLTRFYYFNSVSVIEDQIERIKITAKERSPIYSEVEVFLRKHSPTPNDYIFSAERWIGKVMAKDKTGGESVEVFTPDFHSSKAAALNELENWLMA